MSDTKTVTVSILDKDYQVSCQANEVSALQRSADYLDQKMREMRDNSNVFGLDRLAVMAALNLTNDLLAESEKADALGTQQQQNGLSTGTADIRQPQPIIVGQGFQWPNGAMNRRNYRLIHLDLQGHVDATLEVKPQANAALRHKFSPPGRIDFSYFF